MKHELKNDLLDVFYKEIYSFSIMSFAQDNLSEREYTVFLARSNKLTYKVIGESQGVTPERIRQVYFRALGKLNRIIKAED